MALVSISSIKPGLPFDETCVLEPGEHPFIARRSFVLYRLARIEPADKLLRGVKAGVLTPHEPMAQQPFERIAEGWMRSPHTPQGLRAWWKQHVT
ncbi:MAG: hypothetical protein N2690_07025 [Rhodocyclaceae bacterium]|nr:hypothetical protein [Rhodocyclaceae bacterium]